MRESSAQKIYYILLCVVFCLLLVFFSFSGIQRVLSVIPDDAAYFFKVAENVAAGRGFTFDGIGVTNGFQPLWLYVLLPLFAVFRGSPELMFRLCLVLQLLLVTLAAKKIYSMVSGIFDRVTGLVVGIFFLFLVFIPSVNGMESALMVLMLSVLFDFAWKRDVLREWGGTRPFLFGVILGLCVLSRLDLVFLAISIFAFCLYGVFAEPMDRRGRFKGLVLVAAGTAMVVCPYLAYNHVEFGSIMPISGALKTSFPRILRESLYLGKFGKPPLVWTTAALAYIVWFAGVSKERERTTAEGRFFRFGVAVMSLTVLIHFLHTLLYMKWAVFRWHFIPYAFFVTLAASEPASRFLNSRKQKKLRTIYPLLIALLVIGGGLKTANNFRKAYHTGWPVATYEAAAWARDNTSDEDVFAMKDAGNFSFFSGRKVISLDGVANNMEYQNVLKERRLRLYLRNNDVKYLVQHAFWNNEAINSGEYEEFKTGYKSWRYMIGSDELTLKKENEIYRSEPYFDGPYKTVFIIWRLSGNN